MTYEEYEELRNKKGLKNADVARLANIPASTFTDWKNGKSKPKEDKLNKILLALGVCVLPRINAKSLFSGVGALTYEEYELEQTVQPRNRSEAISMLPSETIEKLKLMDKEELDLIIGLIDKLSAIKKDS